MSIDPNSLIRNGWTLVLMTLICLLYASSAKGDSCSSLACQQCGTGIKIAGIPTAKCEADVANGWCTCTVNAMDPFVCEVSGDCEVLGGGGGGGGTGGGSGSDCTGGGFCPAECFSCGGGGGGGVIYITTPVYWYPEPNKKDAPQDTQNAMPSSESSRHSKEEDQQTDESV